MPLTKRRVTDLWKVGTEVVLDDGRGDSIVVWCEKLTPLQQSEASRHADAARARYLARRFEPGSDEYQQQMGAVLALGDEKREMAEFVVGNERQRLHQAKTLQVSAEEGWDKDGYLQGLYDGWEGGLRDRWLADREDDEAARCFAELERFNAEVEEEVQNELGPLIEAKEALDLDQLRDEMVQRMIEIDSSGVWMEEYYRQQIFMGIRECDGVQTDDGWDHDRCNHKKVYFRAREEVDELAVPAIRLLRDAFQRLEVEPIEGKSSPEAPTSSPSSEPPAEEATEPSSGQMALAQ